MKRALLSLSVILGLCFATPAMADNASILESLKTARAKLVALTTATDKGSQTSLQDEIKAATKEVDDKLEASLADAATPAETKTKLEEFKAVWASFKTTRDTEIIPAVLAGETEKAKGIAQGVQVERFKKMLELLK